MSRKSKEIIRNWVIDNVVEDDPYDMIFHKDHNDYPNLTFYDEEDDTLYLEYKVYRWLNGLIAMKPEYTPRPPRPSVIKKRRQYLYERFLAEVSSRNNRLIDFYGHLSRNVGSRKWRYLCAIKSDSYYSRSNEHEENTKEMAMLRDMGIGKIHFSRPFFALTTDKSLVIAKMVLGNRMNFAYDIFEDKILMDNNQKSKDFWD